MVIGGHLLISFMFIIIYNICYITIFLVEGDEQQFRDKVFFGMKFFLVCILFIKFFDFLSCFPEKDRMRPFHTVYEI